MNKNASVLIYGMMVALVIIILALALATPVSEFITDARSPSTNSSIGLDCDNSSISSFDKAACVTTDLNLFYFIGGLIFIAGAIFTSKIIFGGQE